MIKELFPALAAAFALTGCVGQGVPAKLPVSRDTPFVLDVPETDKNSSTARFQQAEMPNPPGAPANPSMPPALGTGLTTQLPPPPPGQLCEAAPGIPTTSPTGSGKTQGTVRVRAWVNGKPIFEDEVFNVVGPQLRRIYAETPTAQRDAEFQKAFNKALEAIIDNELMYQDCLHLLEKQAKVLESLKGHVFKEAQKQISAQMRRTTVATIEEYRQLLVTQGTTLESIRRMLERDMIAGEYLRQKIKRPVEKEVSHEVIYDYYKQHLNEFVQLDRVKWQNIFIAVGPKHPTMADARQFAEQVLKHWVAGEDFAKLLEFDDGDSRFRNGDGAGEIKGDIKPRELEPYLLALREGEFGPPVELTTGVHLYRVLKRDHAGVMPFDEKTQTQIASKLKNEMAEQERGHLVRQLRERALIEIER